METTSDFFRELRAISNFIDFLLVENRHSIPEDWWIIIADIRGSTQAIEGGRYRDVNLLGASVITAVLNENHGTLLPYVFGGDGATLAIPPKGFENTKRALRSLQHMSQSMYGMELRVGFVAMKSLLKEAAPVEVAKYDITGGNFMALFSGGGLTLAEKWVKENDSRALLTEFDSDPNNKANLEGLSCGWEPLKAQRGLIVSVIVKSRFEGAEALELYDRFFKELQQVTQSELKELSPVSLGNLKVKWPPSAFNTQIRIGTTKETFMKKFLYFIFYSGFLYAIFKWNIKLGRFIPAKYKGEIVERADYKKFDDSLKMVIDCTMMQVTLLQKLLQKYFDQGSIFYGMHASEEALMTCLVFSASESRHVHFIDGARGGYAMAAKQLKEQIKKSLN